MYLLNNEEDDYCVHLDCTDEEYELAESQLLDTDEKKVMFCDHLYFIKSTTPQDENVNEMTLDEYIDYWKPHVEFYSNK